MSEVCCIKFVAGPISLIGLDPTLLGEDHSCAALNRAPNIKQRAMVSASLTQALKPEACDAEYEASFSLTLDCAALCLS